MGFGLLAGALGRGLSRGLLGVGHGLEAAGQRLTDTGGLDGLLDPADVSRDRQNALLQGGLSMMAASGPQANGVRPSFGQALAAGVGAGQQSFSQGLQGQLQEMQFRRQLLQQQRAMQARTQASQMIQSQPGDTRAQHDQRLRDAQAYLAANGDLEGAKAFDALVQTSADKPRQLLHVDLGDRVAIVDPETQRTLGYMPKGAPPKDPNAPRLAEDHFRANDQNHVLDDFRADTKDFKAVMGGWQVFKGAIKEPTLATPFAVADAYGRMVNPGATVRPSTMQMIDQMGSVSQRFAKWYEHNKTGSMPKEVLADFQKILGNIVQMHRPTYEDAYQKAILRGKTNGYDIAPLLPRFDFSDLDQPAPPAAGTPGSDANVRKFLGSR